MSHAAADSRRRILDAAIAAFARDGLAGARVDAIAAAALINKRMLYHYFGDKQALFDAALEAAAERLAAALAEPSWDRAAVDVDAWRLVTAAAAAGRTPPARIRAGLDGWLGGAAERRAPRVLFVLGVELLEAMLPGWIEAELGPFASPEARHRAVAETIATLVRGPDREVSVPGVATAKPRVTLKPRIQPADTRSPSKSSK